MANTAQHTPGPWTYFVGNANGRGLIRIETPCDHPDAGTHIASMTRGPISEANARLIANAPELLAALQAIVEFEASPDFSVWPMRVDAARAAIAKATVSP